MSPKSEEKTRNLDIKSDSFRPSDTSEKSDNQLKLQALDRRTQGGMDSDNRRASHEEAMAIKAEVDYQRLVSINRMGRFRCVEGVCSCPARAPPQWALAWRLSSEEEDGH